MRVPLLPVLVLVSLAAMAVLQECEARTFFCDGFNVSINTNKLSYGGARSACSEQNIGLLRIKEHNLLKKSRCYKKVIDRLVRRGLQHIWLYNRQGKGSLDIKMSRITEQPDDTPRPFICARDWDECSTDPCPQGEICVNGKGTYKCEDRNECEDSPDVCDPGFNCTNTIGSYMCRAPVYSKICAEVNFTIRLEQTGYGDAVNQFRCVLVRRKEHDSLKKNHRCYRELLGDLQGKIAAIWLSGKTLINLKSGNASEGQNQKAQGAGICRSKQQVCHPNPCGINAKCRQGRAIGALHRCERSHCGAIEISNGSLARTKVDISAEPIPSVEPICEDGFSALGEKATCGINGWSYNEFICTSRTQCEAKRIGSGSLAETPVNHDAEVTCNNGSYKAYDAKATCTKPGWSYSEPLCPPDNPIVCNWYNVSIHSDPALYADAISECERRDATLLTQQSYDALKQSQCSKYIMSGLKIHNLATTWLKTSPSTGVVFTLESESVSTGQSASTFFCAKDRNECEDSPEVCDPSFTCENTVGSYICRRRKCLGQAVRNGGFVNSTFVNHEIQVSCNAGHRTKYKARCTENGWKATNVALGISYSFEQFPVCKRASFLLLCQGKNVPHGRINSVPRFTYFTPVCDNGYLPRRRHYKCGSLTSNPPNHWVQYPGDGCASMLKCPGSGIQYVLYNSGANPLQTYNNHLVNCGANVESRLPTSADLPCIKFVLNTHREKFPEHNLTTLFFYANGAANTMTMSSNGELSTSRLSQAQRNQVFPGATAAMCIPACQQSRENGQRSRV
ncbi:neurogenic locus notch homolog protein 2-like [Sycon ciliatum]|uniref:neurogenic locus notch homolog protein 2-like n=1 Tax=Sycon ciliatum TaxID=27933 RepID=UPI0031F60C65